MTTPDETPQERPTPGPRHHYGEIAPGVPRYGQYAPEGWVPPSSADANTPGTPGYDAGPSQGLPPASAYPGFGVPGQPGGGTNLPHRGAGPVPPGQHLAAPRQVAVASRLVMAAGVLQALSGVLLLFVLFLPSVRTAMVDALRSALPSEAAYDSVLADQSALTGLLVAAAVLSLVAAAVYFWLAAKIRRGAGWARTTGLVLAIVSLLALTQPNIFTIVQVGLGVVAVIVLYRSPAKEYFARRMPGNGPHGY